MVDKPRFGVLSSVESQEFKGVRWSIDDRVCDVAARLRGVAPRLKWALSVEDGSEPSRERDARPPAQRRRDFAGVAGRCRKAALSR